MEHFAPGLRWGTPLHICIPQTRVEHPVSFWSWMKQCWDGCFFGFIYKNKTLSHSMALVCILVGSPVLVWWPDHILKVLPFGTKWPLIPCVHRVSGNNINMWWFYPHQLTLPHCICYHQCWLPPWSHPFQNWQQNKTSKGNLHEVLYTPLPLENHVKRQFLPTEDLKLYHKPIINIASTPHNAKCST